MINKLSSALIALVLCTGYASAQTCPTTNSTPAFTAGGNVFGRIAAQWNAYFGTKVDVNNGVLCSPTIVTPTISSALIIAGAGLSNQNGVRNPGDQEVSAFGGTIRTQLWPVNKATSYTVNSDLGVPLSDHGALLIATGASVTFTLPNPGAATKGITYQFGSDGTNGFTLTTAGGIASVYGCTGGDGGASAVFAANINVTVVDDGANYKCQGGNAQQVFDPRNYGALCNGANNDALALQATFTAAQAVGGKVVLPGMCRTNSQLNITGSMEVSGQGLQTGIMYGSLSNDVINVQTNDPITFKDFRIAAAAYMTSGAGISFNGTGGGSLNNYNSRSFISNVNIHGTFDCIRQDESANLRTFGLFCTDYGNDGILKINATNPDAGHDRHTGCVLQNLNRGATPSAAYEYRSGGDVALIGCKLIGSKYGFRVNLTYGPTGTALLLGNSFEENSIADVSIEQAVSGKEFGNIVVNGNQFSSIDTATGKIFYVASGTPDTSSKWVRNIVFSDNVSNDYRAFSGSVVQILDGNAIMVSGNALNNNDIGGPTALQIAGAATNVSCGPNQISGYPSGIYNATMLAGLTCVSPVAGTALSRSFGAAVNQNWNNGVGNLQLGADGSGEFYLQTSTANNFRLGAGGITALTLATDGTVTGTTSFSKAGTGVILNLNNGVGNIQFGADGSNNFYLVPSTNNSLMLGANSATILTMDIDGIAKATKLSVTQATPVSTDTCVAGQIVADASYIYACTASGAWKRSALSAY